MFNAVKYPVSKSRAAYFAAKSALKAGDEEAARSWFNTASAYPTTFYGQLAALAYFGTAPLHIPAPPTANEEERAEFDSRTIVKAIKLCLKFNQLELAGRLINYLAENAQTGKEAMLASELGAKAGKKYISVRGAKKALQNNMVLIEAGYPIPPTPDNLPLSRALTLAITRQESEFDNYAKSASGAIGLMQLMPSTAKEVAKKNNLGFAEERLYEPEYNMTVGSLYLQHLIDVYDGRIPMAIAAYNAGGGNVNKWLQKNGKPADNVDEMVDWIEKIPFSETRNYVQRVLENLQVYRYIESDSGSAKLLLGEDLVNLR
jgi:soluble lytic murein transglycosylase